MPSKVFLRHPYPLELPTIPTCKQCNLGFSIDEEYLFTFLGCVLAGSAEVEDQVDERVRKILERSPKLRARIANARAKTLPETGAPLWSPEEQRIDNVLVKNSRSHALFEHGLWVTNKPDAMVFVALEALMPSQRAEFEGFSRTLLPEVGSRLFGRVIQRTDLINGWIVVQEGRYRYTVDVDEDAVRVRIVIFEYLAAEVLWLQD
ncbi:hypothetical protein AB0B25_26395 [Nocardia sp. NPDC049190]|uniref:hypothetical protein n=1 Tax=Nocardia sp. NPDC049190 TaxID=3155650 RepID=UPI0033E8BC0F